ncbi:MlaD family protein [Dysgonomonas sp. 511]|uniref:MlaD family protein n=1 Tax=Dysgonomonas sp. 511 TaxID=2302930 RepID=UPI0013D73B0C|nr:MlaD family protein [Dysgonomonas sp. 511]NDV79854.1 MCE family protein [Dysgonomonas sp. 511]
MGISKEVKIGVAFIIAIFLLYYGISFLKGVNIFKASNTYTVLFDDVSGLSQSAPVTLNGFQVGLVSSMHLDEKTNKVIVLLNMDKGVKIPKGTKVSLDVSILGSATILFELNPYTQEYYTSSDTIIGIKKKGMMDAADKMLPQVENLIPKLDSILTGVQNLVNNPALTETMINVNQITGDIARSTRQLNAMMAALNKDVPQITGNLNQMSSDLSGVSKQLTQMDISATFNSIDSTMKNLNTLSNQINSKEGSLGLLINDTSLHDSLNSVLNNASTLLEDIRKNPSRYINVKVF